MESSLERTKIGQQPVSEADPGHESERFRPFKIKNTSSRTLEVTEEKCLALLYIRTIAGQVAVQDDLTSLVVIKVNIAADGQAFGSSGQRHGLRDPGVLANTDVLKPVRRNSFVRV